LAHPRTGGSLNHTHVIRKRSAEADLGNGMVT
jgi:hypothetical protein